jgi:hypothetical protein
MGLALGLGYALALVPALLALVFTLPQPAYAAPTTVTFQRGNKPTTAYTQTYENVLRRDAALTGPTNSSLPLLRTDYGRITTRMVSYFDVSSIPATATVISAELHYNFTSGANINAPMDVYQATTNWVASTAWVHPGGDWKDAANVAQGLAAFATVNATFNGWYIWDITPIVQRWVSGSDPNYGVMVLADGMQNGKTAQFHGSGYTGGLNTRPKLIITYDDNVDTTPPVLSVPVVENPEFFSANILWDTDDPSDSQVEYSVNSDLSNSQFSVLDPALRTDGHSAALTGLSANTTYYFRAMSKNGSNLTGMSAILSFTTGAASDTTPPTGTISINGGASYTNNDTVTLTLTASDPESGVSQMQFANEGGPYQPAVGYDPTYPWVLSAGDGAKTVWVKFKNGNELWSEPVSAGITLDTQPPSLTVSSPVDGDIINPQ